MSALEKAFVAALQRVLGVPDRPLPLHEPEFAGREWELIKDCLDSGWVSSVGSYVDEFEARLAEFTGARHAVAVVNGTAALHVALLLAGVRPGDEVLVPALTFVATANAVTYCGAIPHFVDSEETRFGICPRALSAYLESMAERTAGGWRNRDTGRRLAAIVPMHVFGLPADLPALLEVSAAYGLPLIEDAAESLGSRLEGRHTGTFGLFGALSFNGNKIITTGGGGALLTDDSRLAQAAKHLTTTAKQPHPWAFVHDRIAYNYRMPNLNAALGCAQMERLSAILARKRELAGRYGLAFSAWADGEFVRAPDNTEPNHWLNAVRLRQPDRSLRDSLLAAAHAAHFICRPVWTLLHRLPMYASHPRAPLPVAEALEQSLINLPSSPSLGVQP